MSRRPVLWLPSSADWAAALPLFNPSEPNIKIADVRRQAIELLDEIAEPGKPGILVRSPLKMAEDIAIKIDANLSSEVGRASVASSMSEGASLPIKTILGMSIGAGRVSNAAWIGWALIRDPVVVNEGNVVELTYGVGTAPF